MHAHRVRIADQEVTYRQAGTGGAPKVVLVHGLAETGQACWSQQLHDLAGDFDCYAYDLRGHGGSTLGEADATLEQLGGDLLAFLEDVAGPARVVGFSLGATLALWAAAQQSPLVTHVVAMGGSSVISSATAEFFRQKAALIERGAFRELHDELATEVADMFHAHPERAVTYGAQRIASIGEGHGYANAALAMARMRTVPLHPLLSQIDCPVDVVGGEFDRWCPRKASDIIIEGLGDAVVRYSEVRGAGHVMSLDMPHEVSTLLAELLSDPPRAASDDVAPLLEASK